ncbi:hypothetical protein BDAP_002018 [Binucleata daphniae]
MFLYLTAILAYNSRLLGIHTNAGYFFGSINKDISMVKDVKNAHQYTYKRITLAPYFYIEVTEMPNVYWAFDETNNTIKYQYTKMPDENNVFTIVKIPGAHYFHIMHGDRCLTYSEIFDRISLATCNEINGYQSFLAYCHDHGELIEEYLPQYEPPMNKLLFIE